MDYSIDWIKYCFDHIIFFHLNVFTVTRIRRFGHWLDSQLTLQSFFITRRLPCIRNAQLDMVAMFTERKTRCPFSKTVLEQEKESFTCLGTTDVYHCLPDERNRSVEICHQPIWVPKSKIQCIKKCCPLLHFLLFFS